MYIVNRTTNEKRLVYIRLIENADLKKLTAKRYSFDWKKAKNDCVIYKLTFVDSEDILGLIGLIDYPSEERTEIKLLTLSAENIGKDKQYERIAGCLIAFAGRTAMRKFKNYPSLSLVPKTEIRSHYTKKYGMIDGGRQLYLENTSLVRIINEYL